MLILRKKVHVMLRTLVSRGLCTTASKYAASSGAGSSTYDMCIIGGGIVGLGTARALKIAYPDMSIILLEKEKQLSTHQTGHNSGVIHMGIYYTPGSLKAKLCVDGAMRTYEYCDERLIPYKKCGKLIAPITPIPCQSIGLTHFGARENCGQSIGLTADLSPNCLNNSLSQQLARKSGGDEFPKVVPFRGEYLELHPSKRHLVRGNIYPVPNPNFPFLGVHFTPRMDGAIWLDGLTTYLAKLPSPVPQCSGLSKSLIILVHSGPNAVLAGSREGYSWTDVRPRDLVEMATFRLARKSGGDEFPKVVPFRGEYLELHPSKRHLVRGNIYPVPNPNFPFLGVHFTPRMDGAIWLGKCEFRVADLLSQSPILYFPIRWANYLFG
eukprot:sb/3465659/